MMKPVFVFYSGYCPNCICAGPVFEKVYGQVCKRIRRRIVELGLNDIADYRYYLQQHTEEWMLLDTFARVTISRFYRDKMMFAFLQQQVLPGLCHQAIAAGHNNLNIWIVGCGSGEEPYTLAIIATSTFS